MNRRLALAGLCLPVAVPVVVFAAVGFASGMGLAGTMAALADQVAQRRLNPLITGVLGWFPVALLFLGRWLANRWKPEGAWVGSASWGGLVAILGVLVWANLQFWPLFLPERVQPGFPHGMELVIGPIFFAPVAMLLGGLAGGLAVGRLP